MTGGLVVAFLCVPVALLAIVGMCAVGALAGRIGLALEARRPPLDDQRE